MMSSSDPSHPFPPWCFFPEASSSEQTTLKPLDTSFLLYVPPPFLSQPWKTNINNIKKNNVWCYYTKSLFSLCNLSESMDHHYFSDHEVLHHVYWLQLPTQYFRFGHTIILVRRQKMKCRWQVMYLRQGLGPSLCTYTGEYKVNCFHPGEKAQLWFLTQWVNQVLLFQALRCCEQDRVPNKMDMNWQLHLKPRCKQEVACGAWKGTWDWKCDMLTWPPEPWVLTTVSFYKQGNDVGEAYVN